MKRLFLALLIVFFCSSFQDAQACARKPARTAIRAVGGAVLSVRPLRAAKQFIGKRVEGVQNRRAIRQTRRAMRRQ